MSKQTSSPYFRFFIKMEAFIMNNFVPLDKPGPIFKWIFKSSILYFKLGLAGLLKNYFLLITTTGRKTGKVRQTPLEHRYDDANDRYLIMSGWRGRTDWYRNVSANPNIHVQIGNRKFHCRVDPASEEDIALVLEETAVSARVCSRSGHVGRERNSTARRKVCSMPRDIALRLG